MKLASKTVWPQIALILTLAVAGRMTAAQDADPAAVDLIERLSLQESARPIREHPRWARPARVIVEFNPVFGETREAFLANIQALAGAADVILFDPFRPDLESIVDADVFLGFCRPNLIRQLNKLRWIHSYGVGVDVCLADPGVRKLDFIMTNNQRLSAPSIAEVAIAMALMLSKNIHHYQAQQYQQNWARDNATLTTDLAGKTMLVLGLGGIGTETARRASALGMHVIATRNSSREGPAFVDRVGLPDEMYALAADADIVVNALPLTAETTAYVDRRFFDALKRGAFYINVGRGKTTVTADLVAALNDGSLAGAGLDVMDPEPLPPQHPLWTATNVVITPHVAGRNSDAIKRTIIIARENLRRYTRGEKLLSVVDIERGY